MPEGWLPFWKPRKAIRKYHQQQQCKLFEGIGEDVKPDDEGFLEGTGGSPNRSFGSPSCLGGGGGIIEALTGEPLFIDGGRRIASNPWNAASKRTPLLGFEESLTRPFDVS